MLTEYISREQRIADLEIHGWEPVRDAITEHRSFSGIFHAELGIGFAVCRGVVRSVIRLHDGHSIVQAHWLDVPDEVLDAIDVRLAET